MIEEINILEYIKTRREEDILVDLRSSTLYELGSIEGAVNIPVENIAELYRLPKDKKICLFCQIGEISGEFAELLSDSGYNVANLLGGYREYLRGTL